MPPMPVQGLCEGVEIPTHVKRTSFIMIELQGAGGRAAAAALLGVGWVKHLSCQLDHAGTNLHHMNAAGQPRVQKVYLYKYSRRVAAASRGADIVLFFSPPSFSLSLLPPNLFNLIPPGVLPVIACFVAQMTALRKAWTTCCSSSMRPTWVRSDARVVRTPACACVHDCLRGRAVPCAPHLAYPNTYHL